MKRILNKAQRERFNRLREAESQGTLSLAEQEELAKLFQIIEDAEAAYLKPAMDAREQEHQRMQAQIVKMRDLMQRREMLVNRLQQVLKETREEWETIDREMNSLEMADPKVSLVGAIR